MKNHRGRGLMRGGRRGRGGGRGRGGRGGGGKMGGDDDGDGYGDEMEVRIRAQNKTHCLLLWSKFKGKNVSLLHFLCFVCVCSCLNILEVCQ